MKSLSAKLAAIAIIALGLGALAACSSAESPSDPALPQPANNPQPANSQPATFQSIFRLLHQFILLPMLKNSPEGNPDSFAF